MRKYSTQTLPVLLRNPKILLIGAGKVAHEKAEVLTKNNIDYTIIAKENLSQIDRINDSIEIRSIEKDDILQYQIIIDATGNSDVASMLKAVKQHHNFLLNSVDVPDDCDFYFSALLQYNNLKIAVSSNGGSPALAQEVRNKIASVIPRTVADLSVKTTKEREQGIIDINNTRKIAKKILGKVSLVGCGLGDPELLTIKAYNVIKEADVVLYDNLITKEIISLIPEGVDKVFVGKQQGGHHTDQEFINLLLERCALEGLNVARLKSGDPYIFGRGSEEAAYLLEKGIHVEVIPGISSATGGPLMAGIPPTARGYAANFSVVSGCLRKGKTNYDWLQLLKIPNHTTVVLMGLNKIPKIIKAAFNIGIDPSTPAAIISNAGRSNQKSIITTLHNLEADSIGAERPAILVFGEVVKLSELLPSYFNAITKKGYSLVD